MRSLGAIALVTLAAAHPAEAGERSHPLDCLPDRVVRWDAALPDPDSRFGAPFVPGVVLGPPGDSSALV
ncbi:MAG: hypothetical protein GWN07_11045, partial [Actinobacteria bacterium]|nr:hypothetical protein [Actinomycetota bacterium]NIU66025.1 hypothetical protein [Actinomycetota bacterium]NIW27833.1 hypothetical protein [Actinomycetota bacterium]NIX20334.1 hypothetical protein [Actinomycetota bacterium]